MFPTGMDITYAGITPGPDGHIWFTAGQQVGHTTASGGIEYLSLPALSEADAIAAGADGNMWLTSGDSLIRLSLLGDTTIFPIPLFRLGTASQIVRGPQRTLWFKEEGESQNSCYIGEVQL